MKKRILTASLFAIFTVILSSCIRRGEPTGTISDIDKVDSWETINQLITRPKDWQQIVSEKSFQLGNIVAREPSQDQPANVSYYDQEFGNYPSMDGSTVLLPLAAEFAWQFLDLDDSNTRRFLNFTTTSNAYSRFAYKDLNLATLSNIDESATHYYFLTKELDFILATPPSLSEIQTAKSNGVDLYSMPVCYDSFVFITHVNNPIDNLTIGQLQSIYTGKITNWSQLGGNDVEIIPYQRTANSGSQTAMEEMVMQGKKMIAPTKVSVASHMGMLIDYVAEYKNDEMSIGYTFKYYVDKLYTNPNIKILKINDIEPNNDNVRNKSYPYIYSYNGTIDSKNITQSPGLFLNWILSNEGQQCVEQAGYVTL